MTDEILNEYSDAVSKLYKFCKKMKWENKFLRQSLNAIYKKYGVGSGDNLPDDAIPLLANGESFTLTKFGRWAYEMRWELKGYYDENAWTSDYYCTDEARELASICEGMVICINDIEKISRGNWNDLFKSCWTFFDSMDKVEEIHTRVIGETNKLARTSQFKGSSHNELSLTGNIKITDVSAWHETDEVAIVTQVGLFVYEDHEESVGVGVNERELNDWSRSVPDGKFRVTIEPVVEE